MPFPWPVILFCRSLDVPNWPRSIGSSEIIFPLIRIARYRKIIFPRHWINSSLDASVTSAKSEGRRTAFQSGDKSRTSWSKKRKKEENLDNAHSCSRKIRRAMNSDPFVRRDCACPTRRAYFFFFHRIARQKGEKRNLESAALCFTVFLPSRYVIALRGIWLSRFQRKKSSTFFLATLITVVPFVTRFHMMYIQRVVLIAPFLTDDSSSCTALELNEFRYGTGNGRSSNLAVVSDNELITMCITYLSVQILSYHPLKRTRKFRLRCRKNKRKK